jgi:ABC-2 type transport system ATP-binding protein
MIEIEGLTKVFKGVFSPPFTAVDHISFNVDEGDIFGFLGPNGAGKTTTIRMLTTITPPTGGTANVKGFDIVKNAGDVKKHIGYMPEKPGFYEDMNARDLLEFYGEFYNISKSDSKKRSKELMEMTGLYEFRKRKVKFYSHGMRKRVALCQCLMHDPEILILDEPTGGLDPAGTHEFRQLLRGLKKEGKTIFLSSHLLPEVQQICNRVGIIYKGKIVDVGEIEKIEKQAQAENFYITLRGHGFIESLVEKLMEIEGVKFIKPQREKGTEVLRLNLEFKDKSETEIISEKAVDILVKGGAKVSSVIPPELDLEEAFLSLIKSTGEAKK